MPMSTPIIEGIEDYEETYGSTHAHGSLEMETMREFERLSRVHAFKNSVETGCGKSTILFSNLSKKHTVFCIDDRDRGKTSSVNYFLNCPRYNFKSTSVVYGATQRSMPYFSFSSPLDCVLIDGPHGFPFVELEYYFIYPHLAPGAFLIIDDIHIPTIRSFWNIISEDEMFDVCKIIGDKTGILTRTRAPTFNPEGDGWWEQRFNRYRVPPDSEFYLKRPDAE
jgi:hypothetical protein